MKFDFANGIRQRNPTSQLNLLFTNLGKMILVIGYGNTLRSDDGIGQIVAMEVEKWHLPQVRSHYTPQLTPELAEKIAEFATVIFVDACLEGNQVELKALKICHNHNWGHFMDPESLLYLTKFLYQKTPQAWLITIPAKNLNLGENLSDSAQKGLTQALATIKDLIHE
jgi:hydrogenase maturation protease